MIAAELGLGERLAPQPPRARRRGALPAGRQPQRPRGAARGGARLALPRARLRGGRGADRRRPSTSRDRVRAHPPGRPQDRAAGGARPPRPLGQLRAARLRGPAARAHLHRRRGRSTACRPGVGRGSSKKGAEQEAAREALAGLGVIAEPSAERAPRADRPGAPTIRRYRQTLRSRVPEDDQAARLQVVRRPGRGPARAGGGGRRRPERLGEVEHLRRDPLGDRLAEPARAAGREARRRPLRRLGRRAGRPTSARSSSSSTTSPAPGPSCPSPRSRSAAGCTAAARASTSSTARRCAGSTWSSSSPTSGSAAGCAR